MTAVEKDIDRLVESAKKYNWYHAIELADGVYTPSVIPHFQEKWDFILKCMQDVDFEQKRVLDVGCRDGLFSFEAEKKGAREIIGIDNDLSKGAVELLIPHFQSKLKMYEMNLYDLTPEEFGQFDIVMCLGVLYHLRYPFWGLKKLADCLSDGGILLLESGVLVSKYLEDQDVLYCPVEKSPYEATSCTFFNRCGLETTMRSLKFELLDYRTIERRQREPSRGIAGIFKHRLLSVHSALRTARQYFHRLPMWSSAVSEFGQVTRQVFVFRKKSDLQLQLPETKRGHSDLTRYWDATHKKSESDDHGRLQKPPSDD